MNLTHRETVGRTVVRIGRAALGQSGALAEIDDIQPDGASQLQLARVGREQLGAPQVERRRDVLQHTLDHGVLGAVTAARA